MSVADARWVEVTPSQFAHEAEGLRVVLLVQFAETAAGLRQRDMRAQIGADDVANVEENAIRKGC